MKTELGKWWIDTQVTTEGDGNFLYDPSGKLVGKYAFIKHFGFVNLLTFDRFERGLLWRTYKVLTQDMKSEAIEGVSSWMCLNADRKTNSIFENSHAAVFCNGTAYILNNLGKTIAKVENATEVYAPYDSQSINGSAVPLGIIAVMKKKFLPGDSVYENVYDVFETDGSVVSENLSEEKLEFLVEALSNR